MVMATNYVIEIVKLRSFDRQAKGILTEESVAGLMMHLANNPEAGDVIRGTNGVRKLRWGMDGRGKRGGARVIYYYRDLNMPLYLIGAYAKKEKIDLTAREKKEIRGLVDELISHHGKMSLGNVVRLEVMGTRVS